MSTAAWRIDEFGDPQFIGPTVAGRTVAFSGTRNNIFAGIVGDSASVITLTTLWQPLAATPSPFLGYTVASGVIELLLSQTFGGWGYGDPVGEYLGACEGLLTINVTADGSDCSNTLVMAFASPIGSHYNDTALGYGIGAPSQRWTNIRQAVES